MKKQLALVVLSGGQDSVTCFGWALKQYEFVAAISFDYGQRHSTELDCARTLCIKHGVQHEIVRIPFFGKMVTSALTGNGDVSQPHPHLPNVPASFVPNRNAVLLTLSHARAQELGAESIVAGMCQTDYSGYPDCREDFVQGLVAMLNTGSGATVKVETPLMHLNKAQTFRLAEQVDFLQEVIENSHTCYEGVHTVRHSWGYGCGTCPACTLRINGFHNFKAGNFEELPNFTA